MEKLKSILPGTVLCLLIALPSYFIGITFPLLGGPVTAILIGMFISILWKDKKDAAAGIKFTSKKILQYAVILLGFGLDLRVVAKTGAESLPIILLTITGSLVTAYLVARLLHIDTQTATLIGVGSSICGGSAIAATAPVIDASDEEIAQAIAVIFFYNIIAMLIFPTLGRALGFSTADGTAFGIFAGTAINDTSSVTAAASTWDGLWNLGSETLDKAVTVKLTRTLAIIPITLVLALWRTKKGAKDERVSLKSIFPFFIIFFVLASLITTLCELCGVPASFFAPFKTLSKFFIVMAMGAIGLNTNIIKLIKSGGKPLALGASCWLVIIAVSLVMQHLLKFW